MSDSGEHPQKESILKIMDDFLSHLNRTKKLFMILIFASFIIAPLSAIFAVLVLTPQFAVQAGQPYEVGVSFVATQMEGEGVVGGAVMLNESDVVVSGEAPGRWIKVVRPAPQDVVIFQAEKIHGMNNDTSVFLKGEAVKLEYLPAEHLKFKTLSVHPPPRFMYVDPAGGYGKQTDVTTLIIIVVAISAALAATWLVLGIKEYKFFSSWNKRYTKYRKMQEEIDKELEE